MATLQSPGTLVTVVDESFYNPAAPGTVPMLFVASASNKTNAGGTSTAVGTLKANAGKVWTITSQRDLVDTFGTPVFYTDAEGNAVNGGELNEYGLQAAYSFLGVSSKVYVVRADIDLAQLLPEATAPLGDPINGTYWVDSDNSLYGVSEWDSVNRVFVNKTPLVIDNDNKDSVANLVGSIWTPAASFGTKGSYAIVLTSENTNQLWFKNSSNNWVVVGSNAESTFSTSGFTSSCWQTSWPVATSTGIGTVSTASTVLINTISISVNPGDTATNIASAVNTAMVTHGVGAKVNASGKLELYADASAKSNGTDADGKITLANGTLTVAILGLVAQTYGNVALAIAPHTQVPQYSTGKNPSGSVYVKTTSAANGANWVVRYYNGSTGTWGTAPASIYGSGNAAIASIDVTGGKAITPGTLFIESNYDHGTGANVTSPKLAEFKLFRRNQAGPTTIVTSVNTTTFATTGTFQISESIVGSSNFSSNATVTVQPGDSLSDLVTAISAAGLTNISAKYTASAGTFSITHANGGEFKILETVGNPLADIGFTPYNMTTKTGTANLYVAGDYDSNDLIATNWKPLVFEAKASEPFTYPNDGQLWYSSVVDEVDVMYHNGTTWVGYRTAFPLTDPNGPQVAALAPTTQSDGSSGLVDGDIWISTADVEKYGQNIYVWNSVKSVWVAQDPTDQVTPDGWLFADARWSTNGSDSEPASIKTLLTSDYLDPDAPDPALYPQGMRLWNLRRSGFNVKKYESNFIDVYSDNGENLRYNNESKEMYNTARWVSASPNNADGSGAFGRHAQRGVVVKAFKAMIDTNTEIRDTDTLVFNIMATPGYPEAIQNMIAFNTDRKQTAFVVGDTPFRLKPTGTALANWGNNTALALDNNDNGGVSHDEYMGMWYPSGYTNDNTGNYIVVPPSHMMLRVIANSDNKSYPWFAPAGLRRGGVDNATSVGYLNASQEFVTTALHQDLRDVMAGVNINPIATFPGSGIVAYGQKTRARTSSALDRVNVARLIVYLRRQLDLISRPFLFEPNDKITRNEIKAAAESVLLELVAQRAIGDFIVVCDTSNNTPARIDRNELWMDIAIEPIKAVEFIYIPIRIKNTGAIKAGL